MQLGLANKKPSLTGALLGKEVITKSLTLGQASKQHPTLHYSTCQASNQRYDSKASNHLLSYT